MRKTAAWLTLAILCLALCVPAVHAETRQGAIWREGMKEAIEETLFESPEGYSFWYAAAAVKAEATGDGVTVTSLELGDQMTLTVIPEEEARACAAATGLNLAEAEAAGRVQADLSCELQEGSWHFVTLIAEGGHYLRAEGSYAMEAADGLAKYFQLVMNSVTFLPEGQPQAE